MDNGKKYKSPNYGGYLGYKIFHWVISCAGVRPAYVLLAFIVPYYVIIRQSARSSASFYLKKRFPNDSSLTRFFRTIKYFYIFGQVLIDQAVTGILGESVLSFEFPEGQKLLKIIKRKKGALLLTTHLGNWQTAMGAMGDFAENVSFHFQLEEHTSGRHFFDLSNKRDKFRIISPSAFLGGMVEITSTLLSGGCVATMGDRAWGSKTKEALFFGKKALFPITPYHLAHSTNSEIFMILPVRTGRLSFRIDAVNLSENIDLSSISKDEAIDRLLKRYVENLEKCLQQYPYMWLNFYNFWSEKDETLTK
ncbi:MAG: hypothetical protein A2017_02705 [Lentisphaerae bacterium GWF2_44_16]|nr:MAG: hypothetical protein A2017_02705 [Lentisphaerae bacterium GWF2_44_16]